MTYRELYDTGKRTLAREGIREADLDARLLLEFVCHTGRNDLLVHGERPVSREQTARYLSLIQARGAHRPLQYLTGEQSFMGLSFLVTPDVLIPRQDTEILTEEVLKNLHDGFRILDLCTGSGCILLSLLHYSNGCTGVGTDLSAKALDVARQNALALQEPNAAFLQSDLFEKVEGQFEIIVSNPPYIRSDVIGTLMEEVRLHEPLMALDGGSDGLSFYRRIVKESRRHLCGGGQLFLEIGYDQREAVTALLREAGFRNVTAIPDYAGLDRVVYGEY